MDQNKDLFPEGYGIMEVSGLNAELIDVAVYTQQALEATAHIAGVLGEPEAAATIPATRVTAGHANQRALLGRGGRLVRRFLRHQSPGDERRGRGDQADRAEGGQRADPKRQGADRTLRAAQAEILRACRTAAEAGSRTRTGSSRRRWRPASPRGRERYELLDKIRRENVGEYGPFLSAVDRQAMMTISTGVQAVSEGNYGRTDEAMWYVDRIVRDIQSGITGLDFGDDA